MRKLASYVFVVAMLAGWFAINPIGAARAQQTGWSQPVEVSNSERTPSSWFPDIAVGPNNDVHIIWSSGIVKPTTREEKQVLDLLMYRSLQDGEWASINDIDNTGTGGYTVRNSIAVGRDNRLHVLVRRGLRTYYTSAPLDNAWSAQAWTPPRPLNGGVSYFNAIAVDSKGRIHAIYNEAIPDDPKKPPLACSGCADIYYRYSDDEGATWSTPVNLSQTLEGSVKPQIKIAADDSIHIVWEEGFDWYASKRMNPSAVMYRSSHDGGKTWDNPVRFTLPTIIPVAPTPAPNEGPLPTPEPIPDAPRQITLGLFQNRVPVIVYRSNATDKLYYQTLSDDNKTWTKPQQFPNIQARSISDTDHDDYTMATDGNGNVHLILTAYVVGDLDVSLDLKPTDQRNRPRLMHLVWDGSKWSAAEVAATEVNYPGYNTAAIAACDKIIPSQTRRPRVLSDAQKETLGVCSKLERYPEWPRMVIVGNTMYLTWFTRTGADIFNSENASYQVWYATRPLDGQAVVPLPMFTPAPTRAPDAPAPTAAPELLPTLEPAAQNAALIENRPAWEASGMELVGIAALPVVGLLILVIGVSFLVIRRRPS